MRASRSFAAFVVVLAFHVHPALGLAQGKRVAGTGVSLVPPAGFSPAKGFSGFEHAARGASIAIVEFPGSPEEAQASLGKDALAKEGLTLLDSQSAAVGGRAGLLVRATQRSEGETFVKWMLAFGDASRGVMIVAAFPEAEGVEFSDTLRKTLLSASWQPAKARASFEGLPFRVTERAGFAATDRMTSAVLLTEHEDATALEPGNATLVVGATSLEAEPGVLSALAEERVRKIVDLVEIGNVVGSAMTIDGLSAFELTCDAKQSSTGAALRVYQAVIADGRMVFHVQGLVAAEGAEPYVARFRKVARGIKRGVGAPRR